MLTLMMTSLMISTLFFFTKHPLSMGFNLLMQTVIIALMTGIMNYNFWYSFILFLIMVGGMLILFIYMTSVASNEKFNFSMKTTIITAMLLMMMIYISYFISPMISSINIMSQPGQFTSSINWMMSLTKFFTYPQNMKLAMLMSYLFLALIAIVKITSIKYGPLRTK
uniref:NADH-ubiquinone oxidoreductase chain 6 n=1 Tax=Agrilus mali TaxID=1917227 RepID=A0A6M4ZYG3_9COLE|nr:NADH dehydrogenase subunit 6 [Agrilus mali]